MYGVFLWLVIVLLLSILVNVARADMALYLGEQKGNSIAGIAGQVNVGKGYIYNDVRTTIDTRGLTNIPRRVSYYLEGGISSGLTGFSLGHVCKHNVDAVGTVDESNRFTIKFNW